MLLHLYIFEMSPSSYLKPCNNCHVHLQALIPTYINKNKDPSRRVYIVLNTRMTFYIERFKWIWTAKNMQSYRYTTICIYLYQTLIEREVFVHRIILEKGLNVWKRDMTFVWNTNHALIRSHKLKKKSLILSMKIWVNHVYGLSVLLI